jgi:hypothetical protein
VLLQRGAPVKVPEGGDAALRVLGEVLPGQACFFFLIVRGWGWVEKETKEKKKETPSKKKKEKT